MHQVGTSGRAVRGRAARHPFVAGAGAVAAALTVAVVGPAGPAAAVTVAAGAGSSTPGLSAPAFHQDGGLKWLGSYSAAGWCLEGAAAPKGYPGAWAVADTCAPQDRTQVWQLQTWDERPSRRLAGEGGMVPFANEHSVVNAQTGLCLDSNAAGKVYTLPCVDRNPYQSWTHVVPALPAADTTSTKYPEWPTVYENLATNRCLTITDTHQPRTVACRTTSSNWAPEVLLRVSPVVMVSAMRSDPQPRRPVARS